MNEKRDENQGTIGRLVDELYGIVEGDADEKTKVKSYGLVRELVSLMKEQRLGLADLSRAIVIPREVWTPLHRSLHDAWCCNCHQDTRAGDLIYVTKILDSHTNFAANRYLCKRCWDTKSLRAEAVHPFLWPTEVVG